MEARDCDQGQRCLAGEGDGAVCSLPSEASCRGAEDCGGALSCARGECRTSCEASADCVRGECSSGTCVEPVSSAMPDGSACTSDEGCRVGSTCSIGRCRPACELGCPRGSRCLAGTPSPGCSLPDENRCTSTDACTSGLVCAEGECRTPCETDADCGPSGRCRASSCDEPEGRGRLDAGSLARIDGGRIEVPDAYIHLIDTGPRGSQTRLATAFTANPLPSQTVELVSSWTSPAIVAPDLAARGELAPLRLALAGRSDPDERGVAYAGVADGEGKARVFRFPAAAPSEATDVSSVFASASDLVALALAEDGGVVRGLLIRDHREPSFPSDVGYRWTEGGPPAGFGRRVGPEGGQEAIEFGEAVVTGGARAIGPNQDLRYLLREHATAFEPEPYPGRWTLGPPYLSVLDASGREIASDRTDAIFTSSPLFVTGLHDLAMVWDPSTRRATMVRLRASGPTTIATSYDPLGFLGAGAGRPVVAPNPLIRATLLVAEPRGASLRLFELDCPRAGACASTRSIDLATPSGTEASLLAAAPLMNGYALVTADAAGIALTALERDLSVVPGYDDGRSLPPLDERVVTIEGRPYTLIDLAAYPVGILRTESDLRSVTLLVGGLYLDAEAHRLRIRVSGVRVALPG